MRQLDTLPSRLTRMVTPTAPLGCRSMDSRLYSGSGILRDPPCRCEARVIAHSRLLQGHCRRRRRRSRCPSRRAGRWRRCRCRRPWPRELARASGIFGCGATTGVGSAFGAGAPAGFFAVCGLGAGGGAGWRRRRRRWLPDVDGRQPLDRLADHADIEAGQDDRRQARHGPRSRLRSPWPGRAGRRFRGSST